MARALRRAARAGGADRTRARSGQKTGAGFYRKVGKDIQVLDPARRRTTCPAPASRRRGRRACSRHGPGEKFARAARSRASAGAVPVGDLPRPLPLRAVPSRRRSPTTRATSTSRSAGASAGRGAVRDSGRPRAGSRSPAGSREDIEAGKALAQRAAAGRGSDPVIGRGGVHRAEGAYSPDATTRSCRARALPVYGASAFPIALLGERCDTGHDDVRDRRACACGTCGDDVGIVSFKTKLHTISDDGARRPAARDRRRRARLARPGDLAAARAVLARRQSRVRSCPPCRRGEWDGVEAMRREVPADGAAAAATAWCRRSPRCAAWRSAAAASSSCTATARSRRSRATSAWSRPASACCRPAAAARNSPCAPPQDVQRGANGGQLDLFPFLRTSFQNVAMAKVSKSALEAQGARLPARRPTRRHSTRTKLLHVARAQARALAEAGYRPPLPARDDPGRRRDRHRDAQDAAGQHARRRLHHAARLRDRRAHRRVLCGGEVEPAALVDEDWLLELERARLHGAAARREDAGADRAHACNRQAGAQLTRTSIDDDQTSPGRLHRRRDPHGRRQGAARRVPQHPSRRPARARAAAACSRRCRRIDPRASRTSIVGCAMPEGRAGHERRAHRRAARRPARQRAGHDHQPLLLVRPATPWRWPPTASASARPT